MIGFFRSEAWLKIRMLLRFGGPVFWYRHVWKQDANEQMCCSGYECGCRGADHGSYWEWLLSQPPKKVDGDRS